MFLDLNKKKEIVSQTADNFKKSVAIVVAEYKNLTVAQLCQLRNSGHSNGIQFKVLRNTLAKRATKGTPYESAVEHFSGQVLYGFSYETPAALGRLLKKFAKENEMFKIQVVSVEGDMYSSDQIDAVANLPTFLEAVTTIYMTLKAPVIRLDKTLNALPLRLIRVLNALQEKK